MLEELSEDRIKDFFELIGEIECGSHINFENGAHITWLNKKIKSNFARGVKYFSFVENKKKLGMVSILLNNVNSMKKILLK